MISSEGLLITASAGGDLGAVSKVARHFYWRVLFFAWPAVFKRAHLENGALLRKLPIWKVSEVAHLYFLVSHFVF